MGLFIKPIKTRDDLFLHTLHNVFYAEEQILKAWPELAETAANPALKQALETHLRETQQHVGGLETIFDELDERPRGTICNAIDGILRDARQMVRDIAEPQVADDALLAVARAVAHYEIGHFETLLGLAERLGRRQAAHELKRMLSEERAALARLGEAGQVPEAA